MSLNRIENEQLEKMRVELNQKISSKLKSKLDGVYSDFIDLYNNTIKLIKMNIEDVKQMRGVINFTPIFTEFEKLNKSLVALNCQDKMDREPFDNKEAFILDLSFVQTKIEEKALQIAQQEDEKAQSIKSTKTEVKAHNKTTTTSTNNPKSKNFSLLNMFKFKSKEDEIPKAHLEEEVKSYYDPVKKMWIFEGEEQDPNDGIVKPPPLKKEIKGSVQTSEHTNKSTSENKLDALMQPLDLLNRRKGKKGPIGNKPKTTKLQIPLLNTEEFKTEDVEEEFNLNTLLSSEMLHKFSECFVVTKETHVIVQEQPTIDLSKFVEQDVHLKLEGEFLNLKADYNSLLNEYLNDIDRMHAVTSPLKSHSNFDIKLKKNKGVQIIQTAEYNIKTIESEQSCIIKPRSHEHFIKLIEFFKEAHQNLPNIHKMPTIIDVEKFNKDKLEDYSKVAEMLEQVVKVALESISNSRNKYDKIIKTLLMKYKNLKQSTIDLVSENKLLKVGLTLKNNQLNEVVKITENRYKEYSSIIIKLKEIMDKSAQYQPSSIFQKNICLK